jgi:hypothetical protein
MSEIRLKTDDRQKATIILHEALEKEASRLTYSLQLAKRRLAKFERKYNVTSEKFINEWSSEDLEDGDMEYVEWAGEFKLASRLEERLGTLKNIEHETS